MASRAPAPRDTTVTVLEAIQRSSEFLQRKGVESPRLNTELLLAHVLKVPRMNLYLAFDRVLEGSQAATLRDMVVRRGRREPLQHIVGSTNFCGHEIAVSREALVPRPETELLAQSAIERLKKAGEPPPRGWRILDLCTGSGCIAIALAHALESAIVTATELSADALQLAQRNVAGNGLEGRVHLVRSDLFAGLAAGDPFDIIVSNPPYIPADEISALEPEVRDYEPRQALDGGVDGLDFYRRIAAEAVPWIKADGALALEFGDGQAPAIEKLLLDQNWIVEPPLADYTRRLRILVARRNGRA